MGARIIRKKYFSGSSSEHLELKVDALRPYGSSKIFQQVFISQKGTSTRGAKNKNHVSVISCVSPDVDELAAVLAALLSGI